MCPVIQDYARDSIEIQRRPEPVGLDLESLFATPSSPKARRTPVNPCSEFESCLDSLRPPEEPQVAPSDDTTEIFCDIPFTFNDPILFRMFLSELEDHTPSGSEPESCNGTRSELDYRSDPSPMSSVSNVSVPPSSPTPRSLECMTPNLCMDPLDDPLLSNFTDISVLQENCPLLPAAGGLSSMNITPSSPPGNHDNMDVAVVESSECSPSNDTEQRTLELSECIDFLTRDTSSTTTTNTPFTNVPPSSSPTSSTPASSSEPGSPVVLLCNFNFSAASDDCTISLLSGNTDTPSSSEDAGAIQLALPPGASRDIHVELQPSPGPPSTEECFSTISTNTRKRRHPDADDETPSTPATTSAEMTDTEKRSLRRVKNNQASRVSRAKRKQHRQEMEKRAVELEAENEALRAQEQELTVEIERMKRLLLDRLAH